MKSLSLFRDRYWKAFLGLTFGRVCAKMKLPSGAGNTLGNDNPSFGRTVMKTIPKKAPVGGVYSIICLANGKVYIGSSINIRTRCLGHLRKLRKGCHDNRYLQRAWNKYGESAFKFNTIEPEASNLKILEAEQRWIDLFDACNPEKGFNICKKAGNTLGFKASEETRAKLSIARKGKKHSPEHVEKRIAGVRGRKRSEEFKAKVSRSNSRDWIVTHPDGTVQQIKGLRAFCREYGLNDRAMALVALGRRNHHHGFKCRYVTDGGVK